MVEMDERIKKSNKRIAIGLMIPSLIICVIARRSLEKRIDIEFKCKIKVNRKKK